MNRLPKANHSQPLDSDWRWCPASSIAASQRSTQQRKTRQRLPWRPVNFGIAGAGNYARFATNGYSQWPRHEADYRHPRKHDAHMLKSLGLNMHSATPRGRTRLGNEIAPYTARAYR